MKIPLSDNAIKVLEKRYLKKDPAGNIIETPVELFKRVARSVASADEILDSSSNPKKTEEAFYMLMSRLWFLPNSPTLMNAGRKLGQLAACFVLPINDSMESIFEALKNTAMIHKSGGGTGFSFSMIRPRFEAVLTTAGVSSGPISFMNVFDTATETIKQGGARRGANMAVLRVDHPDIAAFINSKSEFDRFNNFNISVALTRKYMKALDEGNEYELVNPRTRKPTKSISAKKIFHMIVDSAWKCGEPGVIFIDRMNEKNPVPFLGDIEATNPCGEQPLLPYESCTLGSINLSRMITDSAIDYKKLKQTVHTAVHFLDNVIEINKYPIAAIEKKSKATRKIGIGVMGFADLLIHLGIAYDSQKAVKLAQQIMSFISKESREASKHLAKTRGNFPAYNDSRFDDESTPFMRNATTTTIAPTGSISIIANTSSGIEPIFAIAHKRRVLGGQSLAEFHAAFEKSARDNGYFNEALINHILRTGSVQKASSVPRKIKGVFKTAHDISPESHINIQAAFQKYTDNAVSKTVNFPARATRSDVEKVYLAAYEKNCMGVTIYRYGSREKQVLNIGHLKQDRVKIAPRPRPEITVGKTERIQTGCGKLYVTVNTDDHGMCEVFAQMGKTGGCASSQIEAAGRLISLALRSGVKVDPIIKQLIGIRCPSPSWQDGKTVLSCPDAIAQILKKAAGSDFMEDTFLMGACPECGDVLAHEEGCMVCHSCGFSKCS